MGEQSEAYAFRTERVYRARVARWPWWSEGLLRCIDVYTPLPGEMMADVRRRADRGVGLPPTEEERASRAAQYRRQAASRAKRQLRWAVISIQADRLLTLTYRDNVTDRARALKDWAYFRKLITARWPDWVYVATMEHQARGAIHFHVAVRGYQDVNVLRSCWLRVVGEGAGNIDMAFRPKRGGADAESFKASKIASYIAKYIGKDFDVTPKGARRFFPSQSIPKPTVVRWWIEAKSDTDALVAMYKSACGGHAIGVKQWLSADGMVYGVSGPPLVDDCPF